MGQYAERAKPQDQTHKLPVEVQQAVTRIPAVLSEFTFPGIFRST